METQTKSKTADREISITRILNAPRELVWEVWTDPKHLAQWWGPRGFTAPTCELDLKPGGKLRIHMGHPDFPNHWMKGVFKEVAPPEKLVFTSGAFIGEDGVAGIEVINTIMLEEDNGKTKFTLHAVVTKLAPEFSLAYEGMNEGWNQSLDKLEETLAKMSNR